jgi:hypothetical protein
VDTAHPDSTLSPQRSEALVIARVQSHGKAPFSEIGCGSTTAVSSTENRYFFYHWTTIS